jgi:hypothetical protein
LGPKPCPQQALALGPETVPRTLELKIFPYKYVFSLGSGTVSTTSFALGPETVSTQSIYTCARNRAHKHTLHLYRGPCPQQVFTVEPGTVSTQRSLHLGPTPCPHKTLYTWAQHPAHKKSLYLSPKPCDNNNNNNHNNNNNNTNNNSACMDEQLWQTHAAIKHLCTITPHSDNVKLQLSDTQPPP